VPNNTGSHAICTGRAFIRKLVTNRRESRPNELNGHGFVSRRIDLDAALKVSAVFDADSSAKKYHRQWSRPFVISDASAGIDVADSFAIDNHFTGVNFRIDLRRGTDDKRMPSRKIGPSQCRRFAGLPSR